MLPHDANQHMLGQSIIDIEDDVAYGEIYFMAFHRTTNKKGEQYGFWVGGRYIDRYEKRNNVWKIAFRSENNDWASTRPESEISFFEKSPDAIRSGRGSNDMINQKEKFYKGE